MFIWMQCISKRIKKYDKECKIYFPIVILLIIYIMPNAEPINPKGQMK